MKIDIVVIKKAIKDKKLKVFVKDKSIYLKDIKSNEYVLIGCEDFSKREALEQETILDKISAEIDQKQYDFMADKDYDEGIRFGLMLAYQIIKKYEDGEQ